jgi:uncharacterized membrane protein
MVRIVSTKRSLVKSISYRLIILCLDLTTVYLMTGKISVAVGFALISNTYSTLAYFGHERLWAKIKWGVKEQDIAVAGGGI